VSIQEPIEGKHSFPDSVEHVHDVPDDRLQVKGLLIDSELQFLLYAMGKQKLGSRRRFG
jgi:hypothetical protein